MTTAFAMLRSLVGSELCLRDCYQASFNKRNAGTNKPVTVSGVPVSGADKDNYTVSQPSGLTANIGKRSLTASITADNKTYDGTDAATISGCSVEAHSAGHGVVSPDSVGCSASNGHFGSAAAADGKQVTADVALTGADKGNYQLSSDTASTSANIGKANPTVTITWSNATYDGNTHPATASVSGVGSPPENLGSANSLTYYSGSSASGTPLSGAPTGAGTYTVKADFTGNQNYKQASATKTITVAKADQTITFAALPDKTYGDPDFKVSATASSGLSVSFSASGNCTVTQNPSGDWIVSLTAAGSCTITASRAGDGNYNAATPVPRTFTINPAIGKVAYIGQTLYVTSGSNSTSAQVALSASVEAAAGKIANAKVTFTDQYSGTVLAKGVRVSPVEGATTPTGTANTVVTLSSGKYGAQPYLIQVKLDTAAGSFYLNTEQLADPTSAAYATITVMVPPTSNTMQGAAAIQKAGYDPAGTYGNGTNVNYTVGLQYNKSGTNPQGQVQLTLDSGGYIYYIKSNSIASVACSIAGSPCKDLTVYTKASMYRIDSLGNATSIDGNVTLRMDAHDGGTAGDTIGFTVLSSKNSSLYYSNNWVYDSSSKSWKTVQQAVSNTGGAAAVIN
jgi:hypothetical protein